jgi:hypothetical protein
VDLRGDLSASAAIVFNYVVAGVMFQGSKVYHHQHRHHRHHGIVSQVVSVSVKDET